MKLHRFVFLIFFAGLTWSAAAQDKVIQDVIVPDNTLPGITELPSLDLTTSDITEFQNVDITPLLKHQSTVSASKPLLLEDNIPADQQELIDRLNYQKKEGPKLKRFKPQVNISFLDQDRRASPKD